MALARVHRILESSSLYSILHTITCVLGLLPTTAKLHINYYFTIYKRIIRKYTQYTYQRVIHSNSYVTTIVTKSVNTHMKLTGLYAS